MKNAILDDRIRRYVIPERIIWQTGEVQNSEKLVSAPGDQASVRPVDPAIMRFGGSAPGILLDFGRELHGGVQIIIGNTRNNQPVRMRVRFGESVSEAMREPNNDHAMHDVTCRVPWCGSHEIGNTGFRFVRIDLLDEESFSEIVAVRGVFLYRDLEYKGTFRCNDERLNRIWQTGAYTVHLCMQDYLWDGIKRDRLVWIGDMYPETMVISTVFGQHEIVPRSLDFVRDSTPLPEWMNGISSYSLWWVIIHNHWYLYHGDLAYLQTQREYLDELLPLLLQQIDDQNRECLSGHRFLDWPSSANPEAIHAGLHALLTLALKAGARLCAVLGNNDLEKQCLSGIERLQQHTPFPGDSKQAAALMVLAGLADEASTNTSVLSRNPLKGLSTFYGYYVLQARARAGDYAGCLDVIRNYWGAMLDLGASTFWEDFDLSWAENSSPIDQIVPEGVRDIHADFGAYCYKGLRHSLCHGWAGGPTAWLSEHVLGVKPIQPGFKITRICPHLGDLECAEGSFPTPLGVLKVKHTRDSQGKVVSTIDAPAGIKVIEC